MRVAILHIIANTVLLVFLNLALKQIANLEPLVGGKWYLIEVLICFSLLANDLDHLFMYLRSEFLIPGEHRGHSP